MITLKVPSCPTMLVGPSGVGDHGEKGDVVVFIDRLLDVDDSSIVPISVRGVDGGNKVKGHLSVVRAISLLAEVGVFRGVFSGDVDSCSWSELVVFESGEDFGVMVDECPETGRGHDGGNSLNWRVLILLKVLWKSASNSGVWKSSELTQESCAGEYPFQRTRYCFFFQRPKDLSLRTLSTSHSGSPSSISGGGSRKLGPCCSVSLYGVRREAWKMSWIFQDGGSLRQ